MEKKKNFRDGKPKTREEGEGVLLTSHILMVGRLINLVCPRLDGVGPGKKTKVFGFKI